MKTIALIVLALAAASGMLIGLRHFYVHAHGAAALGSIGHISLGTQASTFNASSGPVTLSGTAIMDTSEGLPAVPYIAYASGSATSTKQLIYANSRGCLPNAGDLPCVPSYAAQKPYPQLTSGESITVSGYVLDDRFIVTKLTVNA